MSWLARIDEDRDGDIPIAAVDGEIDGSNVGELAERVHAMLTNRTQALVVDLARTRYVDSAGINLLFSLGAELDQRQQRLLLVVPPSSPVARMLAITGVDATVATYPTRDAAIAAAT
jgi:anti-sigma B factor antagonist